MLGLASEANGHAFMVTIEEFLKKTNTSTHEMGHLLGDLMDIPNGDTESLMSYNSKWGFKLNTDERKNILAKIIEMRSYGLFNGNHDTRSDADDLVKNSKKD